MESVSRPAERRFSRRRVLSGVLPLAGLALLSACGGSAGAVSGTVSASVATTASAASPATATSASSTTATAATGSATSAAATTSSGVASATAALTSAAPATAVSRAANSLEVWMSSAAFSLTDGIGADVMKGFLAQHPGLTLQASIESSLDKFKTQVAGGTPPDLFHTQGYVQTTWGVTGIVQPLDQYIARSKNVKPTDIWKFKLDELTWQGKTYALPYSIDSRVIWANDDLYNRAGLDVQKLPATWADMQTAVSKTVVLQGGNSLQQLGWDPFGGSGGRLTFLVPFWQQGGDFAPGDGSKVDIANDMGVTALDWTAKMYDVQGGYDAVTAFGKTQAQGDGIKLFYTSHTAHLYGTIATKAQFLTKVPGLKYHVGQYPLPPNGKLATYSGAWAMCIGTGAKNADGAFALMDYFYQPDVQTKWAIAQLRVPPSPSVAQNVNYTQNDPLLKLTVDAMPYARFVPSIPGGEQILPILDNAVLAVLQKKATSHESLQTAQQLCQVEIDKYRK
jgi:multiple sugar transport system substrate-binding protein